VPGALLGETRPEESADAQVRTKRAKLHSIQWLSDKIQAACVFPLTRVRGFQRLEWQKLRERNEVLDCRVYARAAAWIAGADRWTEATWRDLESQIAPPGNQSKDTNRSGSENVQEPALASAGLLQRRRAWRGRRVFRSSYMS
jgi:phage terminase large subunit GpA-like protein